MTYRPGNSRLRHAAGALAAGVAAFFTPLTAPAADQVDLALLLAVDISISMDAYERDLQRQGYVAAFRDDVLVSAFTSGPRGRIAVAYVEWGGNDDQTVLIDWALVDGPAAAAGVADRLAELPKGRAKYTALGEALRFAGDMMLRNPYPAIRRVIDISGDGVNNEGLRADIARDLVVSEGIVINGLPLLLEDDGRITILDVPNLDLYYEDCVIGGPGAFSLPVKRAADLADAIRTKLLLEVAAPYAPQLLVQTAARKPRVACDIGEQRRGLLPRGSP